MVLSKTTNDFVTGSLPRMGKVWGTFNYARSTWLGKTMTARGLGRLHGSSRIEATPANGKVAVGRSPLLKWKDSGVRRGW